PRSDDERGSATAGLVLAGYMLAFTNAYSRIGAAIGALMLFAAVQITMVSVGLFRGERPARGDWLGPAPGPPALPPPPVSRAAPDPAGSSLMIFAGPCWGLYSLLGAHSRTPLPHTAGNFAWSALFAILVIAPLVPDRHATSRGLFLALASGSLASGVGYTIWY